MTLISLLRFRNFGKLAIIAVGFRRKRLTEGQLLILRRHEQAHGNSPDSISFD
jgi:hypothetical protein